ncbi:MAG: tetratricopeptide repeat protein, partial [Acidobacteriota bacterium]
SAPAISDFTVVIAMKPQGEDAYYYRGSTYLGLKIYDKALVDLNKAIELNPADAEAHHKLGNLYRDQGDAEKALAAYSKAIQADPKQHITYLMRGQLYEKRNELDKAFADFNNAVLISPNVALYVFSRGKIYNKQGKFGLAEADFKRAVELDPHMTTEVSATLTLAASPKIAMIEPWKPPVDLKAKASELYLSASNLSAAKKYNEAITDLSEAIRLNSALSSAYALRGQIYLERSLFDSAIADLSKALDNADGNTQDDFVALTDRGFAYYKTRNYTSAAADLTLAVTLSPTNARGLYYRGLVHMAMKNKMKARSDFQAALKINPNYDEPKQELTKLQKIRLP